MENNIQEKSKSQIKREAEELQELGEKLIKLPVVRLKHMALPEKLLKALIDAQSIKSNVAGRRQRQYIGALMREIDPEPIRHALDNTRNNTPTESKDTKEVLKWMGRLLNDDQSGIEAFISAFPDLERQQLRQLVRNTRKEKAKGKSLKSFKVLKKLVVKCMNKKKND